MRFLALLKYWLRSINLKKLIGVIAILIRRLYMIVMRTILLIMLMVNISNKNIRY